MKSEHESLIIENGWLWLNRKAKYANNAVIRVEKIVDFTWYSEEGDTAEPCYIIFSYDGGTTRKWYFHNKEDARNIYEELANMLFYREEI